MTSPDFPAVMRARMTRYYIAEIDIARVLGVALSLVGRWLRGEARPASEDLAELGRTLRLTSPQLQALLGETHSLETTPRPPLAAVERAAREHWQELCQLPPAFREPVLIAQLRSVTTEDLTT